MTSRERVERIINFQVPDRIAFNFWMDRRRMAELDAKYGADFRINHYDADVVESFVLVEYPHGRYESANGTSWLAEPLFTSYDQVCDIVLPDPNSSDIYSLLKEDLAKYKSKAVVCDFPNVLSVLESMRPQAELYMDMFTYPDELKKLCNKLSDFMAAVAENVCKLDITALYVMDDCACNKGLLISPATLREFILPHWKKVIDAAHTYNKPVFFHSDGNLEEIWDIFACELNVRMLNPLQPNLQDVSVFKRKYHGQTGIYGGIETGILHIMSPDHIREHVRNLFEKAGKGGGLIMSTHDIDYSITNEQLDTFVSAIKSCVY
ncbi:MAG: Uroporphyrinogen decarboxylase (URO-D) [Parcubacteria group bacterium GW2011_GWA2_43_17]|nr:MAG: Uroporphyrinogen decarboxylase (URO-D) [Parcubacteria group bacterium GW2011_GWA2_43_17]